MQLHALGNNHYIYLFLPRFRFDLWGSLQEKKAHLNNEIEFSI